MLPPAEQPPTSKTHSLSNVNSGVTVVTKRLCFSVRDTRTGHTKEILKDVDLCVKPGHLMVIMGPSGSGKTTLLNALAGRIKKRPNNSLTGSVWYDGNPDRERVSKISNYVLQEDHLMEYLTVRESLDFSAQLRLKHLPRSEQRIIVDRLVKELALTRCLNVVIGGDHRKGISGGQKKRVSIAIEMLDDPPLLFLDEPTSGLDSSLAYDVLKVLVRVAHSGRTVICTVHQPRSQTFALFDQLMLLNGGQIVYQGPANAAQDYFASIGHHCPSQFNPADFYLDLLSADNSPGAHRKEEGKKRNQSFLQNLASAGGALEHTFGAISSSLSPPTVLASNVLQVPGRFPHGSNTSTSEQHPVSPLESLAEAPTLVNTTQPSLSGVQLLRRSSTESSDQMPPKHSSSMFLGRVFISPDAIAKLPEAYQNSALAAAIAMEVDEAAEKIAPVEISRRKGPRHLLSGLRDWIVSFRVLCRRTFINAIRNPMATIVNICVNIFNSCMLGFLFFQMRADSQDPELTRLDARDRTAFLFYVATHYPFATMDCLFAFPKERAMFNRETNAHLYAPSAYFLAKNAADLIFQQFGPFLYANLVYWLGGLAATAEQFFVFVLISMVAVFCSASYNYMIGAAFASFEVINIVAPYGATFFMLMGGFLLREENMPKWIGWAKYIAYPRYTYYSMAQNEFKYRGLGEGPGYLSSATLLSIAGVSDDFGLWGNVLAVFLLGVAFRFFAFLVLKYRNRQVGVQT